jgi:tagatose 1,6-diphosphate aldolase
VPICASCSGFFRPDGDPVVVDDQRRQPADLVETCAGLSLPLVVEPIRCPLPGEDPGSAEWKAARVRGIIASAVAANEMGVDMLKVEFPGYVLKALPPEWHREWHA